MKFFLFTKNRAAVWVVVLFLLTLPTFISLVRIGYFPMQDDLQAFRLHQMDKCFQDLQIPCRWVPDAGYQYGYPQFNFYPPSVYYFGELFHLIGFQFIDSVKLLFILGFVLSAFLMYLLLNSFLNKWPAFVGAILYSYVPYKAVEVYVRGAMSEFWALVFFPMVFWAIYRLIETKKTKYIGWVGISIGLLLTTHNLMSFIFLPLALGWALTWVFLEKDFKLLGKLFWGGLLGIGLAAFFTLPVLAEKQYAHLESLLGGYFDWRAHFVDLKQLFVENIWGYGSSFLGPGDDLSLSAGPVHILAMLIGNVLALVSFKKQKKLAIVIWVLTLLEFGVLFMMHQKSSFIWERVPMLEYLQFPWRFMADSIFLSSLIAAMGIGFIENKNLKMIYGGVLIVGVIVLYTSFFQPKAWLDINDQDKFSGKSWEKQLTISIFDYLPIYAKLPPIQKAPNKPEILEGKGQFKDWNKRSDYQFGEIKATEDVLIRLPLFDFPGMKVTVGGKYVNHFHDDCRGQEFCLGLITFKAPRGQYQIYAWLSNTPIRTIGNVLTFLSILIVVGIFLPERIKRKLWLKN